MPIEYAHALSHALASTTSDAEAEACIDELIGILRRDGKLKALPAIVRELERMHARSRAQQATLTVANEQATETARAELGAYMSKDVHAHVEVDDTLIGGWRYADKDTLIDASYKTALLTLYRNVTAS